MANEKFIKNYNPSKVIVYLYALIDVIFLTERPRGNYRDLGLFGLTWDNKMKLAEIKKITVIFLLIHVIISHKVTPLLFYKLYGGPNKKYMVG